jgi:hypothetical protein
MTKAMRTRELPPLHPLADPQSLLHVLGAEAPTVRATTLKQDHLLAGDTDRVDEPSQSPRRPRSRHPPEADFIPALGSYDEQGGYRHEHRDAWPAYSDDRPRSRCASPRPSVFSQTSTLFSSLTSSFVLSERERPRSPGPSQRRSRSGSRNERFPSRHGCTNILATGGEREQHAK